MSDFRAELKNPTNAGFYIQQKKETEGLILVGLMVSLVFCIIDIILYITGWHKTSYAFAIIPAMFILDLIEDFIKLHRCKAEIRRYINRKKA